MTTLYEGTLGDPGLIYPPNALPEAIVQLDAPARTVKALLRGFELGFQEGDRRLQSVSIEVEASFGDNPSQVKVRARTRLAGTVGEWSATKVLVHYTLIAESDD